MCVPMISEGIARAIMKHFGNLTDLREALKAPKDFPEIHISPTMRLGKARISKLAEVFASS